MNDECHKQKEKQKQTHRNSRFCVSYTMQHNSSSYYYYNNTV